MSFFGLNNYPPQRKNSILMQAKATVTSNFRIFAYSLTRSLWQNRPAWHYFHSKRSGGISYKSYCEQRSAESPPQAERGNLKNNQ